MMKTIRWAAASGVLAAGAGGYAMARRWFVRWGATVEEVLATLPGDELLARPVLETTRAVTIDAPPEAVWPWLVQMGQDRAGLYSYDWLERAFGLDFHNAGTIVPAWQRLRVGDQIRAAPAEAGRDGGFTVVAIDPYRSIITAVGDPTRILPLATRPPMPDGGTWVFVLRPVGAERTRLVVRLRARFGLPDPLERVAAWLMEPVHFVMERKQLLGIKARAEMSASAVHAEVAPVGGNGPAAEAGALGGGHVGELVVVHELGQDVDASQVERREHPGGDGGSDGLLGEAAQLVDDGGHATPLERSRDGGGVEAERAVGEAGPLGTGAG
jgi:hypothetical protein